MQLSTKFLEQIPFNTRPKNEEHMLIDMDKSTRETILTQPLQNRNNLFEMAVMFVTDYIEIFNLTKKTFILSRRLLIRMVPSQDKFNQGRMGLKV